MASYIISWHIELDADTPEDAVAEAVDMLMSPDTTATVFDVLDPDDESLIRQIDAFKLFGGRR